VNDLNCGNNATSVRCWEVKTSPSSKRFGSLHKGFFVFRDNIRPRNAKCPWNRLRRYYSPHAPHFQNRPSPLNIYSSWLATYLQQTSTWSKVLLPVHWHLILISHSPEYKPFIHAGISMTTLCLSDIDLLLRICWVATEIGKYFSTSDCFYIYVLNSFEFSDEVLTEDGIWIK
jgi:hypothetical protein